MQVEDLSYTKLKHEREATALPRFFILGRRRCLRLFKESQSGDQNELPMRRERANERVCIARVTDAFDRRSGADRNSNFLAGGGRHVVEEAEQALTFGS